MFQIVINDGIQKIPENSVATYIIGDKIYLKKKLGIVESVAPVKKLSFLKPVECYAKLHISKIPEKTIVQIIKFFKKVYEMYNSESVVLLYYNEKKKKFKVFIPFQKVGGASVEYVKNETFKGFILLGTIHSHANFSAFHSGTDDADEQHFDGLHITIGDLDEVGQFSISSSVVSNGFRSKSNPSEYIDGIECVDEDLDWSKWTGATDKKRWTRWKIMDAFNSIDFDRSWLDKIEKVQYASTYVDRDWLTDPYFDYGFGSHMNNPFTSKFSNNIPITPSRFIRGSSNILNPAIKEILTPSSKEVVGKGIPVKIMSKEDEKKFDPCGKCIFKKYKVDKEEDLKVEINDFSSMI